MHFAYEIYIMYYYNKSLYTSVAVSDFIMAPNFGIVINKMRFSGKPKESCCNDEEWLSEKYTMQMLKPKHRDDVIKYALHYILRSSKFIIQINSHL